MTNQEGFTVEEFCKLAESKGLSRRQIRRLIENRLFPKTIKIGIGRAKGCRYLYPLYAEVDLDLIVHLKSSCPDFDKLRYLMWLEGCDWVWEDIKADLANRLKEPKKLRPGNDKDLDRVDRRILETTSIYARASGMHPDDVQKALWASHWLAGTGEPYPYESNDDPACKDGANGDESTSSALNEFYGDSNADSLLAWFSNITYDEKTFILLNASETFAAHQIRPYVRQCLQSQLTKRLVFPKGENPFFYWLRFQIIISLVIVYKFFQLNSEREDIQKAHIQRCLNIRSSQLLEQSEDTAHGKESSECGPILPENSKTYNPQ